MKIQFNTDKTINGDERHEEFFTSQIAAELERFESYITRIEVYLSDQNGEKDGFNDIKCVLEARLKDKKPIAVSNQSNNNELAISGAIDKLKSSLESILGRMQNHNN